MSLAESAPLDGAGKSGWTSRFPGVDKIERLARSPSTAIPRPGKPPMKLATDRVRAAPAVSPQLSMMIGMTAIGLGMWGTLFPRSVKRTLGVTSPPGAVRILFGLRELWSGYSLAGDPTRSEVLWTRVAADVADIAVLKSLTRSSNPKSGAAGLALGFVLAVTALDLVTAVRMTNVRRNCL